MLLIVDCDLFFPSTVIYSCALTLPFDFQVTFRPLYLILPTYMLLSYMYINIYIYVACLYVCVACFVHHYSFWPPKKTGLKTSCLLIHLVFSLCCHQVASLRAQLEFQTTEMRQSSEQEVGRLERWKVLKKLPQLLGRKWEWESQCQVEMWMWNL